MRKCDHPKPSGGGRKCPGIDEEEESCSVDLCPGASDTGSGISTETGSGSSTETGSENFTETGSENSTETGSGNSTETGSGSSTETGRGSSIDTGSGSSSENGSGSSKEAGCGSWNDTGSKEGLKVTIGTKSGKYYSHPTKFTMLTEVYNPQLANHSSPQYWALYLKVMHKLKEAVKDDKRRCPDRIQHDFQSWQHHSSLLHCDKHVTLGRDPASVIVSDPVPVPSYKDVCLSQPCQNGGTCFNFGTHFMCQCVEEIYGAFCHINNDRPLLHPEKKKKPYNENVRVTFIIVCLLLTVVLAVLVIVLALKIRQLMANRQRTVTIAE
ncbi:hypothetical protein LSAT2_010088 [Lamellibrachia satsuma]|nr:hypothetical protein LSAT2_010088 [Lamellibrachia satsuma]